MNIMQNEPLVMNRRNVVENFEEWLIHYGEVSKYSEDN